MPLINYKKSSRSTGVKTDDRECFFCWRSAVDCLTVFESEGHAAISVVWSFVVSPPISTVIPLILFATVAPPS